MKSKHSKLSQLYRSALLAHLKSNTEANLAAVNGVGAQVVEAGLQTLELAKLHEEILIKEVLPGVPPRKRSALIRRAGVFFGAAVTPIRRTSRGTREVTSQLKTFIAALSQRSVELSAANLELSREVVQRKAAEEALKKSELHYTDELRRSEALQDHLRLLSRQIITAQEDERRKISRELHDVIAQTLTSINMRLATLKQGASTNSKSLERNITSTQRLVEKSVEIVHQFARELRPAVLDDLGLIPALHSFVKSFGLRTKLHVHMKVFSGVEKLSIDHRTVLYRIIQESLTNVARHAHATEVKVSLVRVAYGLELKVKDNGKSFPVEAVLEGRGRRRLGLVGMRERAEMIGGRLEIMSAPGEGTCIHVILPLSKGASELTKTGSRSKPGSR